MKSRLAQIDLHQHSSQEDYEKKLAKLQLKLFLHIDKKEQLQRFHEREKSPYKKWKITPDDWRNRKKWDKYEACYEEMFEKTDTKTAPWTIVPANCKRFARLAVIKTVLDANPFRAAEVGMVRLRVAC